MYVQIIENGQKHKLSKLYFLDFYSPLPGARLNCIELYTYHSARLYCKEQVPWCKAELYTVLYCTVQVPW